MSATDATTPTEPAPARAQRRFSLSRQLAIVWRMDPRRIVTLLSQAYSDWSADGAARLGAALAYYTLFSIAPVVIVIVGIAGFFIGRAAAHEQISPWLQRFLSPEGASAAELMLQQQVSPAGGLVATVIGFVTLFVATSAFVNELRQSLNLVWRVRVPPSNATGIIAAIRAVLTDRVYGFLIAVAAALFILISVAANTAIGVAGAYFATSLPMPAIVLHAINFLVTFVVMSGVFAVVYKTLPDAYIAWGDASIGGMVTALLFDVGSVVLAAFVTRAGASPYGTAAGVLALLAWVFYSAQIFFFGAELTRIFATTHGGGIVPVHRALGDPLWSKPPGLPT